MFPLCRNFRQSNDPAAHTYPDCEQGIQFGNPTYKEANMESEQNSTSSFDSLQNLPHRHQYTRSSQSIVTHATPRIAVSRPSFSETNLTFQNRLALQLAFQVQLLPPDTFEFCSETRSLPRMPPSRSDHRTSHQTGYQTLPVLRVSLKLLFHPMQNLRLRLKLIKSTAKRLKCSQFALTNYHVYE